MLLGFFTWFIGFLIIMGIGYFTMWLYRFIFGFPKRVKQGVKNAVDSTIDRALQRNPRIVEEHNHYTNVNILKKNDVHVKM